MGQVNQISKTGLELVKSFEGLRRRSEPLPGGGWIVGYGHTRSARQGVEVTEREAEYLLRYDLREVEKMVRNSIHAPLNQNEFDAIISFAWNIGRDSFHSSDVLKYINAGEMIAAAESFSAWRKARVDGRSIVVDALVRRRAAEKNLFLSHPSGPPSAPSLVVKPELDVAASVLALSDGALSIESKLGPSRDKEAVFVNALQQQADDTGGEAGSDDVVVVTVEDGPSDGAASGGEFVKLADALISRGETKRGHITEQIDETADTPGLADMIDQAIDKAEKGKTSSAAVMASIWDATDEMAYDEQDDYVETIEDDEFEDGDKDEAVDESPLAAAMAASAVSDTIETAPEDDVVIEDVVAEAVSSEEEMSTDLDEFEAGDDDDDVVAVEWSEVEAADAETDVELSTSSPLLEVDESAESGSVLAVSDRGRAESEWADLNDSPENVSSQDDSEIQEISQVWKYEKDTDSLVEDATNGKKCIVDPLYHLSAEEEARLAASGARRKTSEVWIGALPFILLAITGAVMCTLGVLDWWGLVKSEVPVDENQLYAGPFLTLIGGFGFVFGTYFLIRKLMGIED